MAARAVVFGQASALVAALVAGMYGGTGVFLLESLDIPTRRDQAIYAGFSVLAGIAVIAAAFFLERGLQAPGRRRAQRRHGAGLLGGAGQGTQRAMMRLIASLRVAASRN